MAISDKLDGSLMERYDQGSVSAFVARMYAAETARKIFWLDMMVDIPPAVKKKKKK